MAALLIAALLAPTAEAKGRSYAFGERVLKRGSHGRDVRVLQQYLTKTGFRTYVDGSYGRGTTRSVKRFERRHGLAVDGRVTRRDARVIRARVAELKSRAKERAVAPPPVADPAADTAATGAAEFVQVTKATLNADGTATPPPDAPDAVKRIIEAGNAIAKKPYRYGGGHGKWEDTGYDCSGSVSYALRGGGLLARPLDSSGFMSWGEAGTGPWVSIYSNPDHVYMVVAGLRFDTSGAKQRGGSRWTEDLRAGKGFVVRHPAGL
jgi:hypothetical protein